MSNKPLSADQDPTFRIAEHVHSAGFAQLSARAVQAVRHSILDVIGAGVAGLSTPIGQMVFDMAQEAGGRAQARVWGSDLSVPVAQATFVNAVTARCLELDDVHEGSPRTGKGHGGHVSVMPVPAALACIEQMNRPVSGRELITALAVGGDLIPRLRMAAGDAGRIGWEGPTLGPFGVAATLAKLRGLEPGAIASAFGAAYAHCAGTIVSTRDGTWDVWLNTGIAARAGVVAVDLAQRGYRGASAPLLGHAGLFPLYFRGEYHREMLMGQLGAYFEVENLSVKPYASCKASHHAIYTAMRLRERHRLDPSAIARITVQSSNYKLQLVGLDGAGNPKGWPDTLNEAQFSVAFMIAFALFHGAPFPDAIERVLSAPGPVRDLFSRIELRESPQKNALQAREGYPPDDLEITLQDGTRLTGSEANVIGHPALPMSDDAIAEKFHRCLAMNPAASRHLHADRVVEAVTHLEDVDDVRALLG